MLLLSNKRFYSGPQPPPKFCSVMPKPLSRFSADRQRYAPFWWSADLFPGVHRQHAQLATAENLTTLSILTACFSRILQTSSDIFRVQTRCVSQTKVFRYREIGGKLCTTVNVVKNSVAPT
jgi:hypothetical protein